VIEIRTKYNTLQNYW